MRDPLVFQMGEFPAELPEVLLYASNHHSFVIDAYTKRIFERHGWCGNDADYDALQSLCSDSLNQKRGAEELDYWRDYHAQLVAIGNRYCKPRNPLCGQCPLESLLPNQTCTRDEQS